MDYKDISQVKKLLKRKGYTKNIVANCIKEYSHLITLHSPEELFSMKMEQLKVICKTSDLVYKLPLVRTLECIGIDCCEIMKEIEYHNRYRDLYREKFGNINSCNRSYKKWFIPLQSRFKNSLETGEANFQDVNDYVLKLPNRYFEQIRCAFLTLKSQKKYMEILNLLSSDDELDEELWLKFKSLCEYEIDEKKKKLTLKYGNDESGKSLPSKKTFKKEVIYLSKKDLTKLSIEDALDYCIDKKHGGKLVPYKIQLLECLNYPKITEIIDKIQIYYEKYIRRKSIISDIGKNYKIIWFDDIDKLFFSLDNITELPFEVLVEKLLKAARPSFTFDIVKYQLSKKDRKKEVIQLMYSLNYTFTGVSIVDLFREESDWHRNLFDEIIAEERIRVKNKTAYFNDRISKVSYNIVRCLNFISVFTRKNYYYDTIFIHPLKWFLNNCNKNMVYNIILNYGRTRNVQNERVKGCFSTHHAKKQISVIISVFKRNLYPYLKCRDEIGDFTPTMFCDKIENKRIDANSSNRRTYTDSEINSILSLEEVKSCPVFTLLIILLWEIGLRSGAICNLKYHDIIDDYNKPMHICKVLEKGHKYREFTTSQRLKLKIVTYTRYIEENHPDFPRDSIYVFNKRCIDKPLPSSTLLSTLKRFAKKAGVTSVIVHPHAFRHTVVGKLMDQGNSAELVSKYMGHSSTDITLKYYWLKSIEDLSKEIKNPFMNLYDTPEEKKEEYVEALERANVKIDTSLNIINMYDTMLSEASSKGETAEQVQDRLRKIPNLKKLLLNIADSIAETESIASYV